MALDGALTKTELVDLDVVEKMALLSQVAQELLDAKVEYAKVSGRHAELKAEIQVLGLVKSALQSAIRAEQMH